tara:strand:+ start:641 stop:1294 length:654 start_codon:yes stop_codon:yes gene_type:complete
MEKFIFTLAKEPSDKEIKTGRRFFAGKNEFLKGVVDIAGLPRSDRLEICFAGRSNVGKSSLINAVTGHKTLARTSNTPGRTQEINYFSIDNKMYLVDLPGYGFAEAPLDVVKQWQLLLKSYLSGRQTLRRVFILVDSRRGLKTVDEEILRLLDKAAVNFQIILTKVDKIKDLELDNVLVSLSEILSCHPAAFPEIITTSVKSGLGISHLRSVISSLD